jgi:hypothetical protein
MSDDELSKLVVGPLERSMIEKFLGGASVKDVAQWMGYDERTVKRWLEPNRRLGKAYRRAVRDREDMIEAVRAVVRNPKTPPTSRLAAVAMLDKLMNRTPGRERAEPLLNEGETIRAIHERTRRGGA